VSARCRGSACSDRDERRNVFLFVVAIEAAAAVHHILVMRRSSRRRRSNGYMQTLMEMEVPSALCGEGERARDTASVKDGRGCSHSSTFALVSSPGFGVHRTMLTDRTVVGRHSECTAAKMKKNTLLSGEHSCTSTTAQRNLARRFSETEADSGVAMASERPLADFRRLTSVVSVLPAAGHHSRACAR